MSEYLKDRSKGDGNSFSYLSIFEEQTQFKKKALDEFYQRQENEQEQAESLKPAMFRQAPSQQPKPQESKLLTEIQQDVSEKDSLEELKKKLKVGADDKNPLQHMNEQMFEMMYKRMEDRQIKFYAFLNKEFNVMNYKSARCSMHCFDDTQQSMKQVNKCLQVCREGIKGCKEFTYKVQNQVEKETKDCQEAAKDTSKLTDPVVHWISCYEKLILKFDDMEKLIKEEFGHFI